MRGLKDPAHDPERRELLRRSLASGLTEEWRVPTPNANRASEVVSDANFGWIDIDWLGADTALAIGITDARGTTRMSWTIPLADLAVRP
jgi:hypothetical protein